ncbi:hypothetical protein CB1_002263002 [Camelus ferus]|nr:hypothetical protein CB1_002263002 [Camelus ferus]
MNVGTVIREQLRMKRGRNRSVLTVDEAPSTDTETRPGSTLKGQSDASALCWLHRPSANNPPELLDAEHATEASGNPVSNTKRFFFRRLASSLQNPEPDDPGFSSQNVSCTCPVLESKTDKKTNLTVLATSQLHCDFSLDLKVKIDLKVSDWRTIYLAASNPEKISENGPFHTFMRNVELDDENGIITLTFFVKTCHREPRMSSSPWNLDQQHADPDERFQRGVRRARRENGLRDAGTNEFKVIQASENVLIASNINVDEEGTPTTLTGVFAKGDDIDDELFEKFKEVTIGKEIPEENILKLISLGNETTLFPEYIIHGGRK